VAAVAAEQARQSALLAGRADQVLAEPVELLPMALAQAGLPIEAAVVAAAVLMALRPQIRAGMAEMAAPASSLLDMPIHLGALNP
jgi:hypothetical protein